MPISLFQGERNPPDILDAIQFLMAIVAGGADGLYRNGSGGEVGWRADGSVVDQFHGARAMVPSGRRPVVRATYRFAFPATNPPPTVQINVRSNHYVFRAANAGRFLQVERHDGVPGSQDQVSLQMETGRVAGLRFTPQHPAMDIVMRGALASLAGQRVICDWSGAGIPAGAAAEFRLLNSSRGFEFRNDTGAATQPTVTLRISDAATSNHTTAVFGPFNVPAGALQQVFVHDWPVAHQVRSEIDLDRDGTVDQVQILSANPPPSFCCKRLSRRIKSS